MSMKVFLALAKAPAEGSVARGLDATEYLLSPGRQRRFHSPGDSVQGNDV